MSLDDALALAGQVLADYETADAPDGSGLALVWTDQLADVLRKLAAAARHAGPAGDLAHVTPAGCPAGGPGGSHRGTDGGWLARIVAAWAGRVTGRVPGPRVVLSVAEADTARQALADAGAWHGAFGDCAACVAAGRCADRGRHQVLAVAYAALRARLDAGRPSQGPGVIMPIPQSPAAQRKAAS
jgi:hypothetical protein